jgi:2-dehydro-3-deoxy-L-rhamnonate dehydrogenase (NAD+)
MPAISLAASGAAVVTGAARGIGEAVARRLAEDGWSLLLVDLDRGVEDLAEELPQARSACFDVTDPVAWDTALASEECPPAALVNCAGILGPATPVAELDVEVWRAVLEVNLTGTFVSCRAVAGLMGAAGRGRIVSLASIAGKEGNASQSAYSASKGGVIALTKSLAKELAAQGVLANCIAPTVIDGPLARTMADEQRTLLQAKIPLGRFGQPEEVADLVAWICSPACSFTTGFCFDLTGGRATY